MARTQRARDNGGFCFSLRQWALMVALLAFVLTALLTFGAVLGLRHTKDAWQLVLTDLADEKEKSSNSMYLYNGMHDYNANNKILHQAQHVIQVLILLLDLGTIFGCINEICCGLMIYGIATRSPRCILPWIVMSGVTFLIVMAIIYVAYLDMVPGVYIPFNEVVGSLSLSSIFILMWYTIFVHYLNLLRSIDIKHLENIPPLVIQAYGGYTHTVSSTSSESKDVV